MKKKKKNFVLLLRYTLIMFLKKKVYINVQSLATKLVIV